MAQVRLLARTFFVRLFESELMPPGLPQVQLVIWSVVLVATPTLTLPGVYTYRYTGLWIQPGTLGPAIANDRLVLITIAMLAAGLVAIATWENALPDRRDVRILGVLPIPQRAFVAARLLALGCLFLLFFATLGFLPSLLFSALAWSLPRAGRPAPHGGRPAGRNLRRQRGGILRRARAAVFRAGRVRSRRLPPCGAGDAGAGRGRHRPDDLRAAVDWPVHG